MKLLAEIRTLNLKLASWQYNEEHGLDGKWSEKELRAKFKEFQDNQTGSDRGSSSYDDDENRVDAYGGWDEVDGGLTVLQDVLKSQDDASKFLDRHCSEHRGKAFAVRYKKDRKTFWMMACEAYAG